MQSILLIGSWRVFKIVSSLRASLALAVTLLLLWSHLAMSLSAVAMTLHDEMAMAPVSTAVSSFQVETGDATADGMLCCTVVMALLCPQSSMAGQATAAVTLQTPAVAPAPIFLANILFHAGNIRTPTPPPRA